MRNVSSTFVPRCPMLQISRDLRQRTLEPLLLEAAVPLRRQIRSEAPQAAHVFHFSGGRLCGRQHPALQRLTHAAQSGQKHAFRRSLRSARAHHDHALFDGLFTLKHFRCARDVTARHDASSNAQIRQSFENYLKLNI